MPRPFRAEGLRKRSSGLLYRPACLGLAAALAGAFAFAGVAVRFMPAAFAGAAAFAPLADLAGAFAAIFAGAFEAGLAAAFAMGFAEDFAGALAAVFTGAFAAVFAAGLAAALAGFFAAAFAGAAFAAGLADLAGAFAAALAGAFAAALAGVFAAMVISLSYALAAVLRIESIDFVADALDLDPSNANTGSPLLRPKAEAKLALLVMYTPKPDINGPPDLVILGTRR
jgi:hypothetical protein